MNVPEMDVQSFHSTKELPEKNVRVIVVSGGFRCLGFLDAEGIWRDEFHRKPLTDVIGWMSFD